MSRNCVKLLNKGNLGPDFIRLETNLEESRSILVLLGNIVQTNESFDFRVFLSSFSSFHWSLLESAKKKMRKFFVQKSFAWFFRYSEK